MTGLPEAVEQAIHAADETNTRIAEAANGSDLTDLYTEWREALTALRAAILAYGAARERQGIERAAAVPSTMAAERQAMVDQRRQRFDRDDGLTLQIESEGHTMAGLAKAIRALPVDGADTETQARKEVPAVRPQIGDPPMTRLVPRPDWTPVEFVLAVRAAVWEQGVTPETAANRPTVLALFRPAEEPDPLGFSPERLAQGEADVAAGRVVELGDALQRIRDNPPSAGDRPGNPMPASAPVAPPQAEERADLPASEESSWAPVLVESRTPETESVMIHHAHRGQACVACELAALRSELSASQREVERLRAQGADLEFDVGRLLMERYARRPPPSGENRSEG